MSLIFLVAALLTTPISAETTPAMLKARVISWDLAFKPETKKAWVDRLDKEVEKALFERIDVLVFSELFAWGLAPYLDKKSPAIEITKVWTDEVLPRIAKRLKGSDSFVVLGTAPYQEPHWKTSFNRAYVWHERRWKIVDKLDPTQQEKLEDPPIVAGTTLPLFSVRGATAAVLICYSVEMPEIAARLKSVGVSLLLVPSATSDANGVGRVLRSASARAVELGAAVLVAPLTGAVLDWPNMGSAALYLPDQKGIEAPAQVAPLRASGFHAQDYDIPWGKLLAMRVQGEKPEVRPFLAPSPAFSIP